MSFYRKDLCKKMTIIKLLWQNTKQIILVNVNVFYFQDNSNNNTNSEIAYKDKIVIDIKKSHVSTCQDITELFSNFVNMEYFDTTIFKKCFAHVKINGMQH